MSVLRFKRTPHPVGIILPSKENDSITFFPKEVVKPDFSASPPDASLIKASIILNWKPPISSSELYITAF